MNIRQILLLVGMLFSTVAAAQNLPADTNADGKVDKADAMLIYSYILGTAGSGITLEQVDVNNDGTANTADVVAVYFYIKNCPDEGFIGNGQDSDDSEFKE